MAIECAKGVEVAGREGPEIPEGSMGDCPTSEVIAEIGVHIVNCVVGVAPNSQGVRLKGV